MKNIVEVISVSTQNILLLRNKKIFFWILPLSRAVFHSISENDDDDDDLVIYISFNII